MVTSLQFIFEIQRKFEDTASVDFGFKCDIVYMATLQQFIFELQRKLKGTDTVDIEDIEFTKALKIRILYCIYGQVTTTHIGVSTEIRGYRYSGY
jgi:hypothetical protein